MHIAALALGHVDYRCCKVVTGMMNDELSFDARCIVYSIMFTQFYSTKHTHHEMHRSIDYSFHWAGASASQWWHSEEA